MSEATTYGEMRVIGIIEMPKDVVRVATLVTDKDGYVWCTEAALIKGIGPREGTR